MTGHVIAVAGCKGGVGKTTTAINIGTAAADGSRRVLLVETDLAMANACDFLDLEVNPEVDPTLHDVLTADRPIEDAIYRSRGGLYVLPSGTTLAGYAETELDRLRAVVANVRDHYQLVVLDTPAGVSRETLVPMQLADGVVVVATPRVSAVRDAKKTIELVERVGSRTIGLVLAQTGSGNAPPDERIAEFLGVGLLGAVPDDAAVPDAQDSGVAVVTDAPESPAGTAYRDIAERIGERFDLDVELANRVS